MKCGGLGPKRRKRNCKKKIEPQSVDSTPPINDSLARNRTSPVRHGQLLDAPRIAGSSTPPGIVLLVLKMVIEGSVSMRAASRISGLIWEFLGLHRLDGLSHATVQNYLLRVGLDQIKAVKDPACTDRVWIVDHMIAAGSLKCFVVLSISAQSFSQLNRPLEHDDVDVLSLIPTEISNGAVVHAQLQEISRRVGVPLAILSDCGSDLKKGVKLFQQTFGQTISLHDMVHLASRLVWKRLSRGDRFAQYRQACCQCANQLRQSSLAHLKPPRPKTKARYLNVDPEIRWGRRALWLLDRVRSGQLNDRQKKCLVLEKVEAQVGWLAGYRRELSVWSELVEVGQASCSVVRRWGYSDQTVGKLTSLLGTSNTLEVQELITELTSVVGQQCARCQGVGIPLPGSSEVIESLIGKGKRLLGTSQNNNSLTGQILSIAASTMKFNMTSLLESLQRCRIGHVQAWIKDHINTAIHVARREDLTEPSSGTKVAHSKFATTPTF